MNVGYKVSIKTPQGTASDLPHMCGVIADVRDDLCYILFDCKLSNGEYDHQWIEIDRLVSK